MRAAVFGEDCILLLCFGILSKIRGGGHAAGEVGSLVLPMGALDCSFAIVVLRQRVPEKVGTSPLGAVPAVGDGQMLSGHHVGCELSGGQSQPAAFWIAVLRAQSPHSLVSVQHPPL